MGPGVAEMASTLMHSGVISRTPLPPLCFPFIILKNSEKVSLILFCLGMNEWIGDPPNFELPSWEGIAQMLASTPRPRHRFCTHVDLTNAFCSFCLPPEMLFVFGTGRVARSLLWIGSLVAQIKVNMLIFNFVIYEGVNILISQILRGESQIFATGPFVSIFPCTYKDL